MKLRYSARALQQLEEALGYIAEDNPGAALAIADAIDHRLNHLRRFPRSGRVVPELADPERRELIVAPVRVVYRVVGEEIRILAVVHGRQLVQRAVKSKRRRG